MKKFTSPGGAQRFLSAFSNISPHFRPRRHRLRADTYRQEMASRFTTWNEIVGLPSPADTITTQPSRATPAPHDVLVTLDTQQPGSPLVGEG